MTVNSPAMRGSENPVAMGPTFIWPIRVYWEDTDAGGVVYHASYLRFLERARTEWLRAMGHGQDALRAGDGVVFVVRAMQIGFLRPARLDDELAVTVALGERRRASLVMLQSIRRGETPLIEAQVKVACVTAADFRPRAVPEALAAKMSDNGVNA